MIASGLYIPHADQTPIQGIRVSDLIADDIAVDGSGKVTGTLLYKTGVPGYLEEQQSGHYFPVLFGKSCYKPLHVGGAPSKGKARATSFTAGKDFTPSEADPYLVIRTENCTDGNQVKIYDAETQAEVLTLNFVDATLAAPTGKDAVKIAPQDKVFDDDFGKASDMVDANVKITWNGTVGKVTGDIKWFAGNTKVEAGNNLPLILGEWFKTNHRTVGAFVNNKKQIAGETEWIVHLSDNKKPVVVVDGIKTVATLDLTGATLKQKEN